MPNAIPAFFRASPGGAAAASGSGAGPSLATSVYETRLGLAALSWSRAAFGLSLRAVLRVGALVSSSSASASDYGCYDDGPELDEEAAIAVRVRPWLFWRRRGSKRFHAHDRRVDIAWDLTRARFASPGSPEPSSGYYVAVVVDGEMAVVAGDMPEEAYRKTKAQRPAAGPGHVLVSRREHVSMRDGGHGRGHKTCVTVRGKERQISLDLVSRGHGRDKETDRDKDKGAEVGLSVSVDGDRVLHIRRLRWKFRGSEKVDLGGGDRVLVSWDLHNWLFSARRREASVEPPGRCEQRLEEFRRRGLADRRVWGQSRRGERVLQRLGALLRRISVLVCRRRGQSRWRRVHGVHREAAEDDGGGGWG